MKRFVCFILASIMPLTMSVSAAGVDFLKEEYKSYESVAEISFTLNQPIKFLDSLSDFQPLSMFVNIRTLAESVFKSTSKATAKVSISDDYKKFRMSVEAAGEVPAQINENLSVSVLARSGMWIDLDLVNIEAPKLEIIAKTPYMDKYLHMDMSDEYNAELKSLAALYGKILNPDTLKDLTEKAADLLAEYGKVTYRGTKVTITMDDAAANEYIFGILELAAELVSENMSIDFSELLPALGDASAIGIIGAADGPTAIYVGKSVADGFVSNLREAFKDITLFGKDGISVTYTLSGKYIKSAESNIHIFLDPNEICRVFGTDVAIEGVADFTLHINQTYSNINRNIKIDFPVLTAKNSVTPADMYGYDAEVWDSEAFINPYIDLCEEGDYIAAGKNSAYFGVRNLFESATNDTFSLAYANGTVTVTADSGAYGFKTVSFNVGENRVVVDGVAQPLNYAPIEKDNRVFVDCGFVESVFGYVRSYMSYDIMNKMLFLGFMNPNEM